MESLWALSLINRSPSVRYQVFEHIQRQHGDSQSWGLIPTTIILRYLNEIESSPSYRGKKGLALDYETSLAYIPQEMALCQQYSISCIPIFSSEYPSSLKKIKDPPLVLYKKGTPPLTDHRIKLAIVGSRQASGYGHMVVRQLLEKLAGKPVIIVSGGALGIDAASHQESLHYDIPTVGVLGNGFGNIYPSTHQALFAQMEKKPLNGLITEYPYHTEATKYSFPARNRIIAGMSDLVLVVEAGKKSGALITADFAMEHGINVWAVPSPIFAQHSYGVNALIRDGANPLVDLDEFIQDIFKK